MTGRKQGVTLIELLVVVTIVGILSRIAIPKYRQIRTKAKAASLVSKMQVVRGAAYMALENNKLWPLDAATGKMPTELKTLLPGSLSFAPEPGVSLDWRLTGMPKGDPAKATSAATMGIGVSTTDVALQAELVRQLSVQPTLVTGGIVYWLIWGPTTKP